MGWLPSAQPPSADGRSSPPRPDGQQTGFDSFAAALDDDWPERLAARGMSLSWLAPGMVFGTYRYHVVFDGVASHGVSERLFVETPEGWRIAVTTAHPAPVGTSPPPLALVGATLYDGSLEPALEDAVVLVRDGRIEQVGSRADTPVPDDAQVIDLAGRFLVPGLIDTHVHYSQTGWADGRPDAGQPDQPGAHDHAPAAADVARGATPGDDDGHSLRPEVR